MIRDHMQNVIIASTTRSQIAYISQATTRKEKKNFLPAYVQDEPNTMPNNPTRWQPTVRIYHQQSSWCGGDNRVVRRITRLFQLLSGKSGLGSCSNQLVKTCTPRQVSSRMEAACGPMTAGGIAGWRCKLSQPGLCLAVQNGVPPSRRSGLTYLALIFCLHRFLVCCSCIARSNTFLLNSARILVSVSALNSVRNCSCSVSNIPAFNSFCFILFCFLLK